MRWEFSRVDEALVEGISRELDISPVLASILVNRGVRSADEARDFIDLRLDRLHNPFLMKGMGKAVARIYEAIEKGERILVYGDYDVDGISGTALLVRVLRRLGGDVAYYIPHRIAEGYGLNIPAIRLAYENDVRLLITVDCGVTDLEEIEYAQGLGIDVIVTDHHEVPEKLPPAFALLNPHCPDCPYPFPYLAGVGVAFKLACALVVGRQSEQMELGFARLPEELREELDLVALGTVADIVPMLGENRVLTKYGLEVLESTNKCGLRALLEVARIWGRKLDTHHIAFILGPRINAGGRVAEPSIGVRLLLTEDEEQALELARRLDAENRNRQGMESKLLKEVLERVEEEFDFESERVIVLGEEGWHPGVLGIVASRVLAKYYRPVVLVGLDGELGKGSARSIPSFHMLEALRACHEHLEGYGGHAMAAGLTIKRDNIPLFRDRINDVALQILDEEDLSPTLKVDAEVSLRQIDGKLITELELLKPYGVDNPEPVLVARGLRAVGQVRTVGNGHLKLWLKQHDVLIDGIGFGLSDRLEIPEDFEELDVAFVPKLETWQGQDFIRLHIRDVKFKG